MPPQRTVNARPRPAIDTGAEFRSVASWQKTNLNRAGNERITMSDADFNKLARVSLERIQRSKQLLAKVQIVNEAVNAPNARPHLSVIVSVTTANKSKKKITAPVKSRGASVRVAASKSATVKGLAVQTPKIKKFRNQSKTEWASKNPEKVKLFLARSEVKQHGPSSAPSDFLLLQDPPPTLKKTRRVE